MFSFCGRMTGENIVTHIIKNSLLLGFVLMLLLGVVDSAVAKDVPIEPQDIDGPWVMFYGSCVVDGDLSDWADAEWVT